MKLGSLATGQDFYGRETECADLWRYLADDHVVFSGARRLGKSSILNRIKEEAAQRGIAAEHLDAEGLQSIQAFWDALDSAFPEGRIKLFASKAKKVATAWSNRVSTIKGSLPADLGSVSISLNASSPVAWTASASKIKTRIGTQPVIILLDEFSVFMERMIEQNKEDAIHLLAWLRAWRMESGTACRFLFTGSVGLNALLEKHGMGSYLNDCYQFPLGPFKRPEALAMLTLFAEQESWHLPPTSNSYVVQRTGWLSPFYLCILLDQSLKAARDRCLETNTSTQTIEQADVDSGYENLLASRTRFQHWEKRLADHLTSAQFLLCKDILTDVSRAKDGLTLRQLSTRAAKREADPDKRAAVVQALLIKLSEEGYLSPPNAQGKVSFLSFLLRDWWSRNHV